MWRQSQEKPKLTVGQRQKIKSGSGNGKTPMKVTPEERDLFAETSTGQRSKKRKKDKSKTVGRDGEELTMDTVNLM